MSARAKFRLPKKFKLREEDADAVVLSSRVADPDLSKSDAKVLDRKETEALVARIDTLQNKLYAQRQQKILLVLQGMDTSGKDGTVRTLFSGISPMGLRAVGFKQPTDIELAHDYLWRVHQQVPVKGEIVVFNRSHYEDVLITLVQDMIDAKEGKRRYAQIADFERMLNETGTTIVKIFLHISKDEQRERLQARLDDPLKQWKFDSNDLTQRKKWDDYQRAYEQALSATDADHAPWYVVPANSKPHRDLAIASILLETLEDMKLDFPAPDPKLSKLVIE